MKTKLATLMAVILLTLHCAIGTAHAQRKGMMLNSFKPTAELVQDIRTLASLRANLVRFPVYFGHDPSLANWLVKADAALAECERLGVTLVIDFHEPTPSLPRSTFIVDANDFALRWQAFARAFRDRGHLWYDLCNEPAAEMTNWRDIALQAARSIRQVDTRHAIVFSPRGATTAPANTFDVLPGISNQILQFHFYDWTEIQFNYRPYPYANRTYADLRAQLARVRDAGLRNGVPVYIGEVAIMRDHPNAPRFLRDFTSICDEMGIRLTVHAFREADVWNYEWNPLAWQQITGWFAR